MSFAVDKTLLQIVIPFALYYDEYKQEGFCMVGFHSRLAKEGGERMSDYEIIMVILTVLSLVVVLITKDQKQKTPPCSCLYMAVKRLRG